MRLFFLSPLLIGSKYDRLFLLTNLGVIFFTQPVIHVQTIVCVFYVFSPITGSSQCFSLSPKFGIYQATEHNHFICFYSFFTGSSQCFLFSLSPKFGIYQATEHNNHFMYFNTDQQTLPNGLVSILKRCPLIL